MQQICRITKQVLFRSLPAPPADNFEIAFWETLIQISRISQNDLCRDDLALTLCHFNNEHQRVLGDDLKFQHFIEELFEGPIPREVVPVVKPRRTNGGIIVFFCGSTPQAYFQARDQIHRGVCSLRKALTDFRWMWLPWRPKRSNHCLSLRGSSHDREANVIRIVLFVLIVRAVTLCSISFPPHCALDRNCEVTLADADERNPHCRLLEHRLLPGLFGGLRLPLR